MNKNKLKIDLFRCTEKFKETMTNIAKEEPDTEPLAIVFALAVTLGLSIGSFEKIQRRKISIREINNLIKENILKGKKEAEKMQKR